MEAKDITTLVAMIAGIPVAGAVYILIKRGTLKTKMFPWTFATICGLFTCSLWTVDILVRPSQNILGKIAAGLLLTILLAVIGFISGRIIERRQQGP
jgi:hypothetical protein